MGRSKEQEGKFMNKFAGLYMGQHLAVLAVGALSLWFLGPVPAVILCVVTGAVFQLWNQRQERSEAAWEISEHGTRQLWNDGPKQLVPLSAQGLERLKAIYGGMTEADVKKMMAGAKIVHMPKD